VYKRQKERETERKRERNLDVVYCLPYLLFKKKQKEILVRFIAYLLCFKKKNLGVVSCLPSLL